jgi:hypothetical protein
MLSRRRFLSLAALAPLVAGCRGGFKFLGYDVGAGPLYDENIQTVYVPLFNNRAFQTTPYRGFEVDVTQALVREIGKTSAFRVTSDYTRADTELLGNIVSIQKTIQNVNQQNFLREGEMQVQVDVVWRDLRTGEVLSNPTPRPAPGRAVPNPLEAPPAPFDPNVPVPPDLKRPDAAVPMRLMATGRVIPELGESSASAAQRVQQRLAVQIVAMMEKKW